MPARSLLALRAPVVTVLLILSLLAATPQVSSAEPQQQQPFAVLAVAGLDPLLEDIDHLFAAGQAPQHARQVREVIASLNELRGLDRRRPLGLYLFFPAATEKDPQPLLFFPVADIEQLQNSLQIGDELKLLAEGEDRLTLHTEDGDLPVRLRHGFAFVDPTKTGTRLDHPLPDPTHLIGESLAGHDGVLLIRREGLPPALIEAARGQLRAEALKQEPQRDGEKDAEFALRTGMHNALFWLLESAVQEWQGAMLRWRISAEDRTAHVEAAIHMDPHGRTVSFLRSIRGDSRRFAAQRARPSALSLAVNWQPTPEGRALLEGLLPPLREQLTADLAQADVALQTAAMGVVDALEGTVTEETFDSWLSLQKIAEGRFVLLGATAVAGADSFAAGFQRLLPFAADSEDIRAVEMNVEQAGEIAIHRLRPKKVRKRDRRLYGEDAAIYLAAARGALWIAVGSDGAAQELAGTITLDESPGQTVHLRPRSLDGGAPASPKGKTFVDLSVAARDWLDLVRKEADGSDARFPELVLRAFQDADDDRMRLWLQPDENGLWVHVHFEHGYVRLLGGALADRIARQ